MKKSKQIVAYCFANGVIKFADVAPEGSLMIARGPNKAVREAIGVTSRESYPSKRGGKDTVPLVPGIPEAKDQNAGIDALCRYIEQVNLCLVNNDEWLSGISAECKLRIIYTGFLQMQPQFFKDLILRLTA